VFDPASPLAKAISDVFIGSLIVGGLVFLLVLGLVVYVLLKYGRRRVDDDGREPEQVTGNPKLEIGWTILPALILVGLFIATVATMGAADPPKPANAQPDIIVVGHQWW
jgi:cytochrome c oxidase subunit II